jgi:hypothetical protein
MTKTLKIALLASAASLLASAAYAEPLTLDDTQLDAVAAGGDTNGAGFVCPVIKTDGVLNAANGNGILAAFELGEDNDSGYYTVVPIGSHDLTVPLHATNTVTEDGDGNPFGDFAAPGDTGYTAIWSGQ